MFEVCGIIQILKIKFFNFSSTGWANSYCRSLFRHWVDVRNGCALDILKTSSEIVLAMSWRQFLDISLRCMKNYLVRHCTDLQKKRKKKRKENSLLNILKTSLEDI